MRDAFLRYSWGIFIVLIDLRIGFLDILPDFIGYILMWRAIRTLGRDRSGYLRAEPFAKLLTLLSIAEIVLFMNPSVLKLGESILMLVYSSFILLLTLIMMNFFFSEVSNHASDDSIPYLATKVDSRRWFFNIVSGAFLVYMPFTLNLSSDIALACTIPIGLLSILSMILLGLTCRQAAKEKKFNPRHSG
ncbi:MAG: hypothetical protein K0R67_3213 [Paenibacillus sp.]|nr:hypothetical protein [Paenibacillus sp.]